MGGQPKIPPAPPVPPPPLEQPDPSVQEARRRARRKMRSLHESTIHTSPTGTGLLGAPLVLGGARRTGGDGGR